MIDLTNELGIPISFNPENLETVCGNEVKLGEPWIKTLSIWRSLKVAYDCTDGIGNIVKQPNLQKYRNPHAVLYAGRRGVYWDNELGDLIKEKKIRPDITALFSGSIGEELIRTEGHEHLSGFPEIYETVLGKGGYLLFKAEDDEVRDVFFVFSEKGDHVVFPPGYKHISVNLGETPFVMTDWVSTEANPDFEYIRKHNGGPYWVVKRDKLWFVRNQRYKRIPRIRVVRPAPEIPELGVRKGEPMFNLVKDGKIEMLDFLNDAFDRDFYERAFIEN